MVDALISGSWITHSHAGRLGNKIAGPKFCDFFVSQVVNTFGISVFLYFSLDFIFFLKIPKGFCRKFFVSKQKKMVGLCDQIFVIKLWVKQKFCDFHWWYIKLSTLVVQLSVAIDKETHET